MQYTHSIKNQNDNHIVDINIRNEINHALQKGLDFTYFDGVKLEIIKDFRNDERRETVVNVEGL